MKIYLRTDQTDSRGIMRVVDALTDHCPYEVVDDPRKADVVVVHVIGRLNRMKAYVASLGKPYVVIQYVLRSSLNPDPADWMEFWKGALFVWSYYDLDGLGDFRFHRSPLGVYPIFSKRGDGRRFLVCTHGTYMTEGVRECILAANGRPVLHLGEELNRPGVTCIRDVSDDDLAGYYSQCLYVSGLRRGEGFEFPAAEGLLCGAKPILFDREHYRKWYDGMAEFIPEEHRDGVIRSLTNLFCKYPFVLDEHREKARLLFNWNSIMKEFYGYVGTYTA